MRKVSEKGVFERAVHGLIWDWSFLKSSTGLLPRVVKLPLLLLLLLLPTCKLNLLQEEYSTVWA